MLFSIHGCSLLKNERGEFDSFICVTALESVIELPYLQLRHFFPLPQIDVFSLRLCLFIASRVMPSLSPEEVFQQNSHSIPEAVAMETFSQRCF